MRQKVAPFTPRPDQIPGKIEGFLPKTNWLPKLLEDKVNRVLKFSDNARQESCRRPNLVWDKEGSAVSFHYLPHKEIL